MWGGKADDECLKDEKVVLARMWVDLTQLIWSLQLPLFRNVQIHGRGKLLRWVNLREYWMTQLCCAVWFWQTFLIPFTFSLSHSKGKSWGRRGSWPGQHFAITIIWNFVSNQIFQESKGYEFESETDTETIAKLIKYVFDNREIEDITFSTLVERVIQQLVSYKSHLSKSFLHFS